MTRFRNSLFFERFLGSSMEAHLGMEELEKRLRACFMEKQALQARLAELNAGSVS